MNKYIKEICDFTGLKAKRNIILFEVNHVETRFTASEASVMMHARLSPDHEWQLTRAMPPKTTKNYLKGFFGFGRVTQNGELVPTPSHIKQKDIDKVRKGKIANTEKREKKERVDKPKKEKAVKKATKPPAYSLGELDSKKDIDKAVRDVPDTAASKAVQWLILQNLTNAACIEAMQRVAKLELKESDINKQRRVLRRKGEWK